MDPLTTIVAAIATGAAAGLKGTAEKAVQLAYGKVKEYVERRFPSADVAAVERKPDSEAKRASLAEDLGAAGAAQDPELLQRVEALLAALEAHAPAAGAAIGIDLKEVQAGFLRAGNVRASGTAVRIERSDFAGGIELGDVDAGRAAGSGDVEAGGARPPDPRPR
jgi:hypothetical protein